MTEPGAVFARRRDSTDVELLVEDIVQSIDDNVQAVLDVLMPDGRPPFTVPLTEAEILERFATATPPDWQRWLAELETIPDPAEKRKLAAELFEHWAAAQTVQAGMGPQRGPV